MSDVFIVAEPHPFRLALSSWHDDDPLVLVMGIDDPSALASWMRTHDASGVVVVHRRSVDRQARLVATVASGAVPHVPVVRVAHRASALAAALASRAVASRRDSLASKVEQLEYLLSTSRSGVILSSVAGLRDPAPGLGRHLASLMPWGGPYTVQFAPTVRFGRGPHPDVLSDGGVGPWSVTGGDGPLVGSLQSAMVERPVIDVRAEYGSRGREFACLGWSNDKRGIAGRCPVCGAYCLSSVCLVCHVHVLAQENVA